MAKEVDLENCAYALMDIVGLIRIASKSEDKKSVKVLYAEVQDILEERNIDLENLF